MSRLINPYQVFLGTTGQVLSNGTLEFYENETTTAKAYYSDADLTTVGGTTYTLDAYGRVTGNVWLDGEYRIVVKNSAGATQYTIDDVSSITTSGAGGGSTETVQGTVYNKFINGACRVASDGGSVSVSGSYQESEVAGIFVKAGGTPTNGTADLVKTADVGTSGYALQVTDLTTGAGGTVYYRFRFNSVDSRDVVNGSAVFQCAVLQNTGSSKTYTISVYKANAEDDFSGTTLISASSGDSVSDLTNTVIFHSVSNMGDCSNGIEVVVTCGCGAVTTKDFYINDVVFRKGASQISFTQFPYDRDYAAIKFTNRDFYGPPGYLYGLAISNNAVDAQHDIDISAGGCRNSDDTASIVLSSAITKQIDQNWAAGSAAGGFPSGLTLSNATWYRVFVIAKPDGTTDAGFDTSATAANLLSDATGYTLYRRIGWVRTDGSANILEFRQDGDRFFWNAPFEAATWTLAATAANLVVGAPPSSIAVASFDLQVTAGNTIYNVVRHPDGTDTAASASSFTFMARAVGAADTRSSFEVQCPTDASSQIEIRSSGTAGIAQAVMSLGWIDTRGRV